MLASFLCMELKQVCGNCFQNFALLFFCCDLETIVANECSCNIGLEFEWHKRPLVAVCTY